MNYAFDARNGQTPSLQNWNEDITNWNVSNVTYMEGMFNECKKFNQPIGDWNVSNVITMEYMFSRCYIFNQPIGDWDTSNVTNMSSMFSTSSAFNQNLRTDGNKWNVSKVLTMVTMFVSCDKFNGDISNWDTSNVTSMYAMFKRAYDFNQPIGSWNTNSCKVMTDMFHRAYDFNQPIGNWDVSKVENMSYMFYGFETNYHKFNQPIGNWVTSNVSYMTGMFYKSLFNQPIGDWNVSNVTIMRGMFNDAGLFSQDIRKWTLKSGVDLSDFCSSANAFIERWKLYPGLDSNLQGGDAAQPTRDFFYSPEQRIHTFVNDAEFINAVIKFRQDFVHGQPNNSISTDSTPKYADLYGYIQNWDTQNVTNMNNVFNNNQSNISGELTPFGDNGNHGPVLSVNFNEDISNWNTSNVTSMYRMFKWSVFNGDISNWNVSKVRNMGEMFTNSYHFNGDISNWNTSNVTSMYGMFWISKKFNQNISSWDTSKVTNMINLFADSVEYNQPLTGWDTSSVQDMSYMFSSASKFNQDITGSNWNVSNVTDMIWMFSGTKFNRDISNWNVSNVTSMLGMFFNVSDFNQNISSWDTGKVKDMYVMLEGASSFNQAIGGWDVSSVTKMNGLFKNASNFNQSLSNWNTSNVTGMIQMFNGASVFAYDIRSWNVDKIVSGGFNNMLYQATNFQNIFNQYPGFNQTPNSSFFDPNWFPDPVSSISGGGTKNSFIEGTDYQWTRVIAQAGETPEINLINNFNDYPGNDFYLYFLIVGGGGGGGCASSNNWNDARPDYKDDISIRETRSTAGSFGTSVTGGGGQGGDIQTNISTTDGEQFDGYINLKTSVMSNGNQYYTSTTAHNKAINKIEVESVGAGGSKPEVVRTGEGLGTQGYYWTNIQRRGTLYIKDAYRYIQQNYGDDNGYGGESKIRLYSESGVSKWHRAYGGAYGSCQIRSPITWNYGFNTGFPNFNDWTVYFYKYFNYVAPDSTGRSGGAGGAAKPSNVYDHINGALYSGKDSTKLTGNSAIIPINDSYANNYYGGGGPAGLVSYDNPSTQGVNAEHRWANNNTATNSDSEPNVGSNWGIGGRGMKQSDWNDEYLDSEGHDGTAGYDGIVMIWIGVKKPL